MAVLLTFELTYDRCGASKWDKSLFLCKGPVVVAAAAADIIKCDT